MATRTANPIANETDAAANVPTDFPRVELIGACSATRPPATTVARTGNHFSTLFGLEPVDACPHVHLERWIHLEGVSHLAADDLRRLIHLVPGRLEEQLVVDLE